MRFVLSTIGIAFTIMILSVNAFAGIVEGKLSKYISNDNGIPTGGSEIISYRYETCGSEPDPMVGDVLDTIIALGKFTNIPQLEAQVNRVIRIRGCSSNFNIIDIYVDEK